VADNQGHIDKNRARRRFVTTTTLKPAGAEVRRIQKLLDPAVLVPIKPLTKIPALKGWQNLKPDAMSDPRHLAALGKGNIGVVLGRASGGLCTIDLDEDAAVEPFLKANPRLRRTTQTKRVRGCNIWVRIEGEYPGSAKLKTANGRAVGEWRADGNQTVIHGRAIDKAKGETEPTQYAFLNEAPPIRVRFDQIVFPQCFFPPTATPPIRLHPASASTSCILRPASCITPAEVVGLIKAQGEVMASLKAKHPGLPQLYESLIERRFDAVAGGRNDFIVQSVPFLYRAVAPAVALQLLRAFYDCHRAIFKDSREQHMKEAAAMIKSVTETYNAELSPGEREIYNALSSQGQDVFRVCRDLALLPEPERPPLTFFLSFEHCGARTGIFATQAQRIMRKLTAYAIIRLLKKGTRRAAGVRGEAGLYQWLLTGTLVL
jgi:hypothetical protein